MSQRNETQLAPPPPRPSPATTTTAAAAAQSSAAIAGVSGPGSGAAAAPSSTSAASAAAAASGAGGVGGANGGGGSSGGGGGNAAGPSCTGGGHPQQQHHSGSSSSSMQAQAPPPLLLLGTPGAAAAGGAVAPGSCCDQASAAAASTATADHLLHLHRISSSNSSSQGGSATSTGLGTGAGVLGQAAASTSAALQHIHLHHHIHHLRSSSAALASIVDAAATAAASSGLSPSAMTGPGTAPAKTDPAPAASSSSSSSTTTTFSTSPSTTLGLGLRSKSSSLLIRHQQHQQQLQQQQQQQLQQLLLQQQVQPLQQQSPKLARSCTFFIDLNSPLLSLPLASTASAAQSHSFPHTSGKPQQLRQSRRRREPADRPKHAGDAAALNARLASATIRRLTLLHDRKLALIRRAEHIRYRVLLCRQRDRSRLLKVRARHEFNQSAAHLKRALLIKTRRDTCAAQVEHAQSVSLLHRFMRREAAMGSLAMRRPFADAKSALKDLAEAQVAAMLREQGQIFEARSASLALEIDSADDSDYSEGSFIVRRGGRELDGYEDDRLSDDAACDVDGELYYETLTLKDLDCATASGVYEEYNADVSGPPSPCPSSSSISTDFSIASPPRHSAALGLPDLRILDLGAAKSLRSAATPNTSPISPPSASNGLSISTSMMMASASATTTAPSTTSSPTTIVPSDAIGGGNRASIIFNHQLSASAASVHLSTGGRDNNNNRALESPISELSSVVSTSSSKSPTSPQSSSISSSSRSSPSRARNHHRKTSTSAAAIHASLLSKYTPLLSEPLAVTVRRCQSLPPHLFDELDESDYLELLTLLPPITRFTLRELDTDEIITNVQLRHDLYFDPNLQFKPNVDGERGEAKRHRANAYWAEVDGEIAAGRLYRIPLLLFEIRVIIIELLPYSDEMRDDVLRNIDVRLIAQQLEHGVLDALALIKYLADLLRANCAPARDKMLDTMLEECKAGRFGKTLKVCFDVLEMMKLDYANHQLSRLRPLVVEHAVEFEHRWFKDSDDFGSVIARSWIKESFARANSGAKTSPPPFNDVFIDAILNLISQSSSLAALESSTTTTTVAQTTGSGDIPETLRMDTTRLMAYRNDWQDITILAALLILFGQAAGSAKCTSQHLVEMKKSLWVLLNDSDTSMSHIVLEVARGAGKIRGRDFNDAELKVLGGLVDKTLSPESKLYVLISSRVGTHLHSYVAGVLNSSSGASAEPTAVDKGVLAKHGLGELVDEIRDLCERVGKLAQFNLATYNDIYWAVYDECRAEVTSTLAAAGTTAPATITSAARPASSGGVSA